MNPPEFFPLLFLNPPPEFLNPENLSTPVNQENFRKLTHNFLISVKIVYLYYYFIVLATLLTQNWVTALNPENF